MYLLGKNKTFQIFLNREKSQFYKLVDTLSFTLWEAEISSSSLNNQRSALNELTGLSKPTRTPRQYQHRRLLLPWLEF